MKIVTWNCHFGFDKVKAEYIDKYNADIYIIQECTKEDVKNLQDFKKYSTWYGDDLDSKHGVGYFSNIYKFELLPEHNKDFRFIVPYKISDEYIQFTLFSIWTKDKDINNKKVEYTEQTWAAINYEPYKKYLNNSVLLIGDFNSNNFWHKQYISKKKPSQNDIRKKLLEYKIESAYHKYNECENGIENEPTLIWQMNEKQTFHIDYCFVSSDFIIKYVEVESINTWRQNKLSDHCPLIINIEMKYLKIFKIKEIFDNEFNQWNITLPKENLEKRNNGYINQSGWLIQYCFGNENGKEYMDYYSSHRMTDDDHVRIFEDGEKKDLSFFWVGYSVEKDDPEKTEENKRKYYEHNKLVAQELIEKGFDKFTMNMTLKSGMVK